MPRWAALIGAKNEGRAAAADAVAVRLRALGLRIGGFAPRPVGERRPDGHTDLELEDLASGARVPLAEVDESTPDLCSYRFADAAFATAARWVEDRPLDVALLGGIGAFEAARRGHWPLVERLVAAQRGPLLVLVVRRESLAPIVLALPGDPVAALDLPADDAALDAFAAELLRFSQHS